MLNFPITFNPPGHPTHSLMPKRTNMFDKDTPMSQKDIPKRPRHLLRQTGLSRKLFQPQQYLSWSITVISIIFLILTFCQPQSWDGRGQTPSTWQYLIPRDILAKPARTYEHHGADHHHDMNQYWINGTAIMIATILAITFPHGTWKRSSCLATLAWPTPSSNNQQ